MREGLLPLLYQQTVLKDSGKLGKVVGRRSERVNQPIHCSKTEGLRSSYGYRKGEVFKGWKTKRCRIHDFLVLKLRFCMFKATRNANVLNETDFEDDEITPMLHEVVHFYSLFRGNFKTRTTHPETTKLSVSLPDYF